MGNVARGGGCRVCRWLKSLEAEAGGGLERESGWVIGTNFGRLSAC